MFNPMLSGEFIEGQVKYGPAGKVAMPKLNGFRGLVQDGVIWPRSLKPMRNLHTLSLFSHEALNNLDGELVVGAHDDPNVFSITSSGVGATGGTPDVTWHVFDYFHPTAGYLDRLRLRDAAVAASGHSNIKLVPWKFVKSDAEVKDYLAWALANGYEGLVLRCPLAKYKQGRASDLEGTFLRVVPWHTSEAVILGIREGQINNNVSVRNELGYLKKSSAKENKVGSGAAGSFDVKDLKTGVEFSMAVPDEALQAYVWAHKEEFLQAICRYKYKDPVKVGGKPRFPQWEGLRRPEDMS